MVLLVSLFDISTEKLCRSLLKIKIVKIIEDKIKHRAQALDAVDTLKTNVEETTQSSDQPLENACKHKWLNFEAEQQLRNSSSISI